MLVLVLRLRLPLAIDQFPPRPTISMKSREDSLNMSVGITDHKEADAAGWTVILERNLAYCILHWIFACWHRVMAIALPRIPQYLVYHL